MSPSLSKQTLPRQLLEAQPLLGEQGGTGKLAKESLDLAVTKQPRQGHHDIRTNALLCFRRDRSHSRSIRVDLLHWTQVPRIINTSVRGHVDGSPAREPIPSTMVLSPLNFSRGSDRSL